MQLSLTRSALWMLLLLCALGNFVEVQPGQITRDVDNKQLTDNRRDLQSLMKPRTLLRSRGIPPRCGDGCVGGDDCSSQCPFCTHDNLCY
nr:conotoxin precursor P [Conus ebraeus]UMA82580.1 conotoxin precursor P [Conus ebraeus]